MTTAMDVVREAQKYIGVTVHSAGHRAIVDKYNSVKPLPRGYRVGYNDDWCDTFVSFIAIETGATGLIGRECGVQRHVDIFKDLGIWIENGTTTPKAGDIICYNWNDGTQPNDGWADHIGFVETVWDGVITTIEGNSQRMVRRNKVPVGYGYIRGFARPKYSKSESIKPEEKPSTPSTAGKWGKLSVDKKWGTKTSVVLAKAYGTVPDGVISHQYKQEANEYIYAAEFDKTLLGSQLIRAIQKRLKIKPDGLCGTATVKAMQRKAGTTVDGIISPTSELVGYIQRKLNEGKLPF